MDLVEVRQRLAVQGRRRLLARPRLELFRLAIDGITSFSTVPLRFVSYLGFAVFVLSLGLIGYALWGRLVRGETPEGWTSVFVTLTFLSGVQLVSIGILGAYLSRIFEEVKARPLYVVASDSGIPNGGGD